jgi:hypothetical protein
MTDIRYRLDQYPPPDRTTDDLRQLSIDIQDALAEIRALDARLDVPPVPVPTQLDCDLDTLVAAMGVAIVVAIDAVHFTTPLTSSMVHAALGRIIERTTYEVAQDTYAKLAHKPEAADDQQA